MDAARQLRKRIALLSGKVDQELEGREAGIRIATVVWEPWQLPAWIEPL